MLPDTVLLVDDEVIVLDVLRAALEKKGFKVRSTTRFGDAQMLIRTEQFGCVLVDKNLPDGNGLELIRMVREQQPLCACLVMTAYPNAESILEALRLGAVDYLEKPFPHLSIVQEKIRSALERQRLVAERDELFKHVKVLAQADPVSPPELLAVQAAAQKAQAEADAVAGQLDAVRFRLQRAIAALKEAQAGLVDPTPSARAEQAQKLAALLEELQRV